MKQKLLILTITLISLSGTCTLAFFPMDQSFEYCYRCIAGNRTITIDKNTKSKENSLEEIARDKQYGKDQESIKQWRERESKYSNIYNETIEGHRAAFHPNDIAQFHPMLLNRDSVMK